MIKYLKDLECINLERLLLLRGKELSLTDEECHILLLIDKALIMSAFLFARISDSHR